MNSIYFQMPIPKGLFINANGREHWAKKATMTRELRERAAWWGARQKLPKLVTVPLHCIAVISPPSQRRFDPPNAAPTVKAIIDGLTDYGMTEDDSSKQIPVTSFVLGTPIENPTPEVRYRIGLYFEEYKGAYNDIIKTPDRLLHHS